MSSLGFDGLLLLISDELTRDQLDALKFLFRGVIGKRDLEKVDKGVKLFQLLFDRSLLSPDQTDLLAENLCLIKRADLSERLRNFHRGPEEPGKKELDLATDVLADHLGRSWRKLARKLALTEARIDSVAAKHPTDLEETIRELMKEWRRKRGADCQVSELIEALRSCQFNLTADTLEDKLRAAGFALT
ncbi:protein FADD [Synchiropus splendidus]|uniref:protein FADD n=1 Tax=Synchiropus splendidus TaxID=270530 RepID=UPI00237ED6F3|nr:protein FADD [Synchiropus splendidus]